MRLAMLRCAYCGDGERKLFLHHGKVFCAICLVADEKDDMAVRVKIAILHAQAVCDEAKRVRKR